MLLRQCFAQSRLRGGRSAPLTEVKGSTFSSAFQRVGLCLVFSPGACVGGFSRQTSFLFLTYDGEIVSLFPLINARCVTSTSVDFSFLCKPCKSLYMKALSCSICPPTHPHASAEMPFICYLTHPLRCP